MALMLQLVVTSSASASCGDYLLHRSRSQSQNPMNVEDSRSSNPASPAAPVPCRGMNCSKRAPLVPVPLQHQWQRQDQSCLFEVTSIADGSLPAIEWMQPVGGRLPIRLPFRLDRPPQMG